jgi:hypothetical protein
MLTDAQAGVHRLTLESEMPIDLVALEGTPGTEFTCFTSTKVQILTQNLVQKYKY